MVGRGCHSEKHLQNRDLQKIHEHQLTFGVRKVAKTKLKKTLSPPVLYRRRIDPGRSAPQDSCPESNKARIGERCCVFFNQGV